MTSAHRDNVDLKKWPHIVALAIHGGAGGTTTLDMPPDLLAAYRARLRNVLNTTYSSKHTSSLDAVCHAVSQLEDSPLFNAGKGAVFDSAGRTVCEASLMTTQPGFHSKNAAVTGVRQTKNPILLVKVLLENNTDLGGHAFYSGNAAEKAGWKYGTEKVSKRYYYTKRRWLEHKRGIETGLFKPAKDKVESESDAELDLPPYATTPRDVKKVEEEHEDQAIFDSYAELKDFLPQGTVGAVALDSSGHLSVATSTGGKTNKFPGRIGDTPSVGSGFLADSWSASTTSSNPRFYKHIRSSGFFYLLRKIFNPRGSKTLLKGGHGEIEQGIAISGTGDGDFFLRTNFASSIAHRIRYGNMPFEKAIRAAMDELIKSYGSKKGVGGAIVLDKEGKAFFPLAANTMNRGLISAQTGYQTKIAIFYDESLA
ncbi:related to asparaginase 2 [Melanopsichium pennsylvanicum]|uniref:Related to asparaginase 2 n=2 Tax=Melanopsichium pennsylvanicum TaxID=63383 RepID=A0AAJ4XR55_9BASI|nr:related to asparaginase 2 [Melanopsichium pennsylvanicum 4]SNX87714.1 related to asparaginase 2 [Melanopsichium pennsylvanicum]